MAVAHETRVLEKAHPPMRQYPPSADWRMGCVTGICYNLTFALEAIFCSPCAFGYVWKNIENGNEGCDSTPCCALTVGCYLCFPVAPCIMCLISHQVRQMAVRRFNLKDKAGDCCDKTIGCCCCSCSLCQIRNELVIREEATGSLCADPSPNYSEEKWAMSKASIPSPTQLGVIAIQQHQNNFLQQQQQNNGYYGGNNYQPQPYHNNNAHMSAQSQSAGMMTFPQSQPMAFPPPSDHPHHHQQHFYQQQQQQPQSNVAFGGVPPPPPN